MISKPSSSLTQSLRTSWCCEGWWIWGWWVASNEGDAYLQVSSWRRRSLYNRFSQIHRYRSQECHDIHQGLIMSWPSAHARCRPGACTCWRGPMISLLPWIWTSIPMIFMIRSSGSKCRREREFVLVGHGPYSTPGARIGWYKLLLHYSSFFSVSWSPWARLELYMKLPVRNMWRRLFRASGHRFRYSSLSKWLLALDASTY